MSRPNDAAGFTLIELLVVIAIIAILAAMLMPALTSATDRSRVTQCRSNLTNIGMALKMYYNDQGDWPPALRALHDAEFVTDRSILVCTKTGAPYCYARPDADTPTESFIVSCCAPGTPEGQCPHSYRTSFVALRKGGEIVEVRGTSPDQPPAVP